MASSTDMSFWIKFFKEAGIPAGDAANYAVTFTDNRITRAMLIDLTKEYLNDMGISILGDVIAILKHAKTVHNQDVRDRVLRDTATPEIITPKRSTPASRTIAHHIGSIERSSSPLLIPSSKLSPDLSARLGSPLTLSVGMKPAPSTIRVTTSNIQKEEVPVPKKNRRVFPEDEGHYTVNYPQGTSGKTKKILERQRQQAELQRIRADEVKRSGGSKQTSVFSRLGKEKSKTAVTPSSSPTVTITGLGNINMPSSSTAQQSIFARLGGKTTVKRAATSTVTFDDDEDLDDLPVGDPLEYAGVLKESPTKKAKLQVAKKLKKTAHKTLAKAKVQPETAGIFATSSGQVESSVKSRLGPKSAEVSSTTHSPKAESVKKTSLSRQGSRQGKQNLDSITITVDTTSKVKGTVATSSTAAGGVFSRLGKPKS